MSDIKLYLNDEKFAEFDINTSNYQSKETMSKLEVQMVSHNEALHILEFLQELQSLQ